MINDENRMLLSCPETAAPTEIFLVSVETERKNLETEHPGLKFILTTEGWVGVSMYFAPDNQDEPVHPQPVFLDEPSIGEEDSGTLSVALTTAGDPDSVLASAEFFVMAGQLQKTKDDVRWPDGPFVREVLEELEYAAGSVLKSMAGTALNS